MKKNCLIQILVFFVFTILISSCKNTETVNSPAERSSSHYANLSKKGIKWTMPKGAFNIDTTYNPPPANGEIIPKGYQTGTRVITCNDWADQYQESPGKYLGGMFDLSMPHYPALNLNVLRNTWGFNSVIVSDSAEWSQRKRENYPNNNILVSIGQNFHLASSSEIDNYIKTFPSAQMFFIDEPQEKSWTDTKINLVANLVQSNNPNAKLFLIDYNYVLSASNLNALKWQVNNHTNVYIMCDEYRGNIAGPTAYYWDFTQSNFPGRVVGNWINTETNTGSWWSGWLNNYNSSYSDLFSKASQYGYSSMWVFISENTYIENMAALCSAAWAHGWLKRMLVHWTILQQCDNPNDPVEDQVWYTVSATSYNIGYN